MKIFAYSTTLVLLTFFSSYIQANSSYSPSTCTSCGCGASGKAVIADCDSCGSNTAGTSGQCTPQSGTIADASSCDATSSCMSHQEMPQSKIITASQLKKMMNSNPNIIIVDARTAEWDDKERIGNAISIPCDSKESVICSALPNKNSCIVVYCAGVKCPASHILIDTLKKLGYTDLHDCSEGIPGWKAMGYPVTKATQ